MSNPETPIQFAYLHRDDISGDEGTGGFELTYVGEIPDGGYDDGVDALVEIDRSDDPFFGTHVWSWIRPSVVRMTSRALTCSARMHRLHMRRLRPTGSQYYVLKYAR